MFASPL